MISIPGREHTLAERIDINHGLKKNLISMALLFLVLFSTGSVLIIARFDVEFGISAIIASFLIPGIAGFLMLRSLRRIPLDLELNRTGIRFNYFMDMKRGPKFLKWEDVEVYDGYDSLVDTNGHKHDLTYLRPEQFDIIERYISEPGLAMVTTQEGRKRLEDVGRSMRKEPEHSLKFSNLERKGMTRKDWTVDREGIRSTVHGRLTDVLPWSDIVNITNACNYQGRRSTYNTVTITASGERKIIFDSREYKVSRLNELFDILKEYSSYHDIPLENPVGF
jgi:hypothetical protein